MTVWRTEAKSEFWPPQLCFGFLKFNNFLASSDLSPIWSMLMNNFPMTASLILDMQVFVIKQTKLHKNTHL